MGVCNQYYRSKSSNFVFDNIKKGNFSGKRPIFYINEKFIKYIKEKGDKYKIEDGSKVDDTRSIDEKHETNLIKRKNLRIIISKKLHSVNLDEKRFAFDNISPFSNVLSGFNS